MLKCDVCLTEGHYKLRQEGRLWKCSQCRTYVSVDASVPLHMKTNVGSLRNVSQARVNELDRRVILPYTVPGKDYMVGRRNNDGSISDKAVDLRP